jgi:hypothetical protein
MIPLKKSYYPNIQQAIGILLIFIFLSMIFGYFASLSFFTANPQLQSLALLFSYTFAAGGTVLVIIRMKKVQHPELSAFLNYSQKLKTIFITLILTLSVIVIIEPITNLIPIPDTYKSLFEELFKPTIPAFLTAVIIAPVLEEMIFRGIILEGFLRNYSPAKSILLASLLFGLAHLNIWQFIGAFLIGVFISWIYWKTRSIGLAIGIHITNNFVSYMAMYLSSESIADTTLSNFIGNNQLYFTIVAVSALILFIGIYFHKKWLANKSVDIQEN